MVCTYASPGCPEAVKKLCVHVCRLRVCVHTHTDLYVCQKAVPSGVAALGLQTVHQGPCISRSILQGSREMRLT